MATRSVSPYDWKLVTEACQAKFPIGCKPFTQDTFVQFAAEQGLLVVPSADDKQSDAWKAGLQRRHEVRNNINKMARKRHELWTPFQICSSSPNMLEIRPIVEAIAKHDAARKMDSLATTKERQLRRLMEASDWDALPASEKLFAEEIHGDIKHLVKRVDLDCEFITEKLARLQKKLQALGLMLLMENGDNGDDNGDDRDAE